MCHIGEQQEQQQEQQRQPIHVEPQQVQQVQQTQQVQQEQQEQQEQREQQNAQRQANAALVQQVTPMTVLQPTQVPPDVPVQEQEPAPLTYKERRERKQKAKKARKKCPVGTSLTYDMVEQLQDRKQQINNSANPHLPLMTQTGTDMKSIFAFCHGHRTKKNSQQPATPADQAWKEADEQFIRDYCTNDLETRRPHLDRIVNELLSMEFSPQVFSPANMRRNMASMKTLAERVIVFRNILRDPVNTLYFEEMDPLRKQMLNQSFPLWEAYSDTLTMVCNKNGVDFNYADYYNQDSLPIIQMGINNTDAMIANYQAQIPHFEQMRANVREEVHDTILENHEEELDAIADLPLAIRDHAATRFVDRRRETQQMWEHLKQDSQLALTQEEQEAPANAFLNRSTVLLQSGEEHQEENRQTMALMRDLSRNQDQVPSWELYNRVRDFTAPRVQQILDCDVDAWKQLSPAELIQHAEQLQTMAEDSSILFDLLATKHPTQLGNGGRPLTLHQELVGQQLHEFDYKCATVQALAERARAFAVLTMSWTEGNIDPECLTEEENAAMRSVWALPEQLMQDKLDTSERQMQQAAQRYHDIRTPGTPACQQWLDDFFHQHSLENYVVITDKFDAVIEEFLTSSDPVMQKARDRIRNNNYKSLAYTPTELKQRGYQKEDIGEKIFRSFGTFLAMEAPQTILSPAQFRQMLLDLGAGAGLSRTDNKPPSEEVQQAVQQNNRGLALYRHVLRAQFDMIARKYGNAMEQITLTEGLDHFCDFTRDFADQQVTIAMVNHYPGFFDFSREEDRLLQARINYYDAMGALVMYSYAFIQSGAVRTDADLHAIMRDCWTKEPACAEARAYLQAHDPTFPHDLIDWTQRVQNHPNVGRAAPNTGTP